jgi:hypothetical protein
MVRAEATVVNPVARLEVVQVGSVEIRWFK